MEEDPVLFRRQLGGWGLAAARVAWLLVVVPTLALSFFGFAVAFADLTLLVPESILHALAQASIDPVVAVVVGLALALVFMTAIGAVMFWKRPADPMVLSSRSWPFSPSRLQGDLAVAGSTLAVAALANPMRNRLQRAVDLRFNRTHIDAVRTLSEFSNTLPTASDLRAVATDLHNAAERTFQPERLSVWVRSREPADPVKVSEDQPINR